jgi:protein O-GlcNAc transferase
MDSHRFADEIPALYWSWGNVNTYPRVPLPYIEILDTVQGMTTPTVMQLLNHAVSCLDDDECYLEVGTWRGATLIGALLGNDAFGYAIDNDVMDEHDGDKRSSQDVWRENVVHFGMQERTAYIDASVPAIWETLELPVPVGVYLFDGDKSTDEAASAGIMGVLPFLSKRALIILDDANDMHVRMAAQRLLTTYPRNTAKLLDAPTPSNCWGSFWNGVMVIVWQVV